VNKPPFLDTNIFIYAFIDDARTDKAQELLAKPYVTSVQALNEFASVMRRKTRKEWRDIRTALLAIGGMASNVLPIDISFNSNALDLVEKYNLAFYDALMVAAALAAESSILLTEDMQDGSVIEGSLTIVNPFR
jgi:predicted nucleic acid-binding protein